MVFTLRTAQQLQITAQGEKAGAPFVRNATQLIFVSRIIWNEKVIRTGELGERFLLSKERGHVRAEHFVTGVEIPIHVPRLHVDLAMGRERDAIHYYSRACFVSDSSNRRNINNFAEQIGHVNKRDDLCALV